MVAFAARAEGRGARHVNSGRRALWVERKEKTLRQEWAWGAPLATEKSVMLWGEVGKSQFLCYLAGHAKEPGFYPGSSGKQLDGFKQETEMLLT